MLYQLGDVQFAILPLNVNEVAREAETAFATKEVVGRSPPLEHVGEGTETVTLSAKLFPDSFGGLSTLEALDSQRVRGSICPLMRGDGVPQGWFRCERLAVHSTYLGADGVGKVIEVSIQLRRDEPGGGGGSMASFGGLF